MSPTLPPEAILGHYCPSPADTQVTPLGQGNINDTFLVEDRNRRLVLQRINGDVFQKPHNLIHNLKQLNGHLQGVKTDPRRRWEDPLLLPGLDGSPAIEDDKGSLWRALSYISNSQGFEQAETLFQAEQTGWALGYFHKRLAGLDNRTMAVALPDFHSLTTYLLHFQASIASPLKKCSNEVRSCMESIGNRQQQALTFEHTLHTGQPETHIVHGDPKIANVLFDRDSGLAISLIDLDTVGPGFIQHDIGDCLRSVCNSLGEDGTPASVSFDLKRCGAALRGYFQASGELLNSTGRNLIYDGLLAICFELGLRFFTDYLNGGLYFKSTVPEELLTKARVQFALLEDIVAKEKAIRKLTVS